MPSENEINEWAAEIRRRYENYLKASFYFKDGGLRQSFAAALDGCDLMKGDRPDDRLYESTYKPAEVESARELAAAYFQNAEKDLLPALREDPLYAHQRHAIRAAHVDGENVVVATGTASGKTESFLYPILFELYRQHLDNELYGPSDRGVRALILYPMNALVNDQRARLGEICRELKEQNSGFAPTFGQYTGATPENEKDSRRNALQRKKERLANELIYREEMRETPPHILLTNYSMLEYLLIRPDDSPLFETGQRWQFIVLDEAHQYRGAKGMEMGMLIRRLKERLRGDARERSFRCIATSATISSEKDESAKSEVAEFAAELFGEKFENSNIIFNSDRKQEVVGRRHLFLSALEGAFVQHVNGEDRIVLNRKSAAEDQEAKPLEIALCKECGQHYYVGAVKKKDVSEEAVRDPSADGFGVDYYLPLPDDDEDATCRLCRRCGKVSDRDAEQCGKCRSVSMIAARYCDPDDKHRDRIRKCEVCNYGRGGIGDPVQEIVHGSDGPNAVIATTLHGLFPTKERRRVLAFTDSRQGAAAFAWYAEDSYMQIRDRNLIMRALRSQPDGEVWSLSSLENRLQIVCEEADVFSEAGMGVGEDKRNEVMRMIYSELLTDEKRISLEGVGLMKWFVEIPEDVEIPGIMLAPPWSLDENDARNLIAVLLQQQLLSKRAVNLIEGRELPWEKISRYPQQAAGKGQKSENVKHYVRWDGDRTVLARETLPRLLPESGAAGGMTEEAKRDSAVELLREVWRAIRERDKTHSEKSRMLTEVRGTDGCFRLNLRRLRVQRTSGEEVFQCNVCARLQFSNLRGICFRNKCPGLLEPCEVDHLSQNHYRILYEDPKLPPWLRSEEHTAQVTGEEARKRQDQFKKGEINLLSSSTTFELGVDLGNLEVVFLRNVPPEPFNYTQRAGRVGRREGETGVVVTYCCRRPHDLYHFSDPRERILDARVYPPQLRIRNEKIISRHVTAVALSAYFKEFRDKFKSVREFVDDEWDAGKAIGKFRDFCETNASDLLDTLYRVVPREMHEKMGLNDGAGWIKVISGKESRFAGAVLEVCEDYSLMIGLEDEAREKRDYTKARRFQWRVNSIAREGTISFLSRKAIIPKYGFPVDVVSLEIRSESGRDVELQRDLSVAIAEYAPESKIIADKKEWESFGIKMVAGRGPRICRYTYDEDSMHFEQREDDDSVLRRGESRYLSPEFGFVTAMGAEGVPPRGGSQRLYTTRPRFRGFEDHAGRTKVRRCGVDIVPARPGSMVVLCEGRNGKKFRICMTCGAGFAGRKRGSHKNPNGFDCGGGPIKCALGHEFVTDVTKLYFPGVQKKWTAYSLAYALLLGAADRLGVPDADLNITITRSDETSADWAIILYDNVPGGAGLVSSLEKEEVFIDAVDAAAARVDGRCGCDSSCYGCLRSFRNQFAHPRLDRRAASEILEDILRRARPGAASKA
ncbi:MAG: DEAD/DEAH box helicase [Pirellulales bacterium]|nr:DEAD/DEAH box helicase [Pirellulales bacterium]